MSTQNAIDLDTAFNIADWEVFQDKNGRCWAAIPEGEQFRVLPIRSLAFAEKLFDLIDRLADENHPICMVQGILGSVEEYAMQTKVELYLGSGN